MYRLSAILNGINVTAGFLEEKRLIKFYGISTKYSTVAIKQQWDTASGLVIEG